MRIISRKTLVEYWQKCPETEQPLKAWYQEAKAAEWASPQDIKDQYRSASIVANNRVVFNIKGNAYRLVVAVAYSAGNIFIKFVGSHQEYDQIDVGTVERSDQ